MSDFFFEIDILNTSNNMLNDIIKALKNTFQQSQQQIKNYFILLYFHLVRKRNKYFLNERITIPVSKIHNTFPS
jgi:protein-arginine kinase